MLTIGKLAVESGTSRDALSYHEREGLLAPAAKTGAGYRFNDLQPIHFTHRHGDRPSRGPCSRN
ncbi:MerR family transcriptional regulator [Burkholderia sp. Bp9142]|uniref:MerR family transcriptional regulator n=1 Tax=Burkholderia sp. Bp9142 TaxID=2184573 RepID=UPI000F5A4131|nr:MerR family DNA-binding transcriptional regulator [Burkholderia sp. Bp9142]RQR32915.1 MerR family transcriptional regulator [Burkholderia sp. Bp9142]